jgi:hypothetical protein
MDQFVSGTALSGRLQRLAPKAPSLSTAVTSLSDHALSYPLKQVRITNHFVCKRLNVRLCSFGMCYRVHLLSPCSYAVFVIGHRAVCMCVFSALFVTLSVAKFIYSVTD